MFYIPDGLITGDSCVVQATAMCMYDCANSTCSTRFAGKKVQYHKYYFKLKMKFFSLDVALIDSSGGSVQRLYQSLKPISNKIPTFYFGRMSRSSWISFDLGEIQLVRLNYSLLVFISCKIA